MMVTKLIKTEKDYNRALSRIEGLMDAHAGSPEAEELELLAALVEMYEDSRFPMQRPDPIDAIKFRIDQLGMGQQGLVPFIGSRSKVSEVLHHKKPLSLAMMRALHNGLGIPAEVLLQEPGAKFPEDLGHLEWGRFPLKEMARRGWIPESADIKNRAEEYIRDFINQAGGIQAVPAVLFRKGHGPRQNEKMDKYALLAWCTRVISLAKKSGLKAKYRKGTLTQENLRDIAKLSNFDNGPILAKEYLSKLGIALLAVPHLSKTYLDGALLSLEDGTPVIAVTLRHDRIDNFWFCLLHELGHVIGQHAGSKEIIIDDMDLRGHKAEVEDPMEREADRVAEEAFIPCGTVKQSFFGKHPSTTELESLANSLKIHPAIIAGRIRFEQKNYRLLSKYVGSGEVRKHFQGEFDLR
jgi:HTH-type transcriptional regulator/antitoxin HigA